MSATSSATMQGVPLSEWSGKLPAWGTTSDGAVSEHPTPGYLTSVRDGSVLLPTPTRWVQGEVDLDKYLARREREKAKGRNGNGFGLPLDMAVRLLPTPTTIDGGRTKADLEAGLTKDRRGFQNLKLTEAVKLLPTPTVNDSRNHTPGPSQFRRNSLALPALVVTLATSTSVPTSQQSDDGKPSQEWRPRQQSTRRNA